MAPAEGRNVRNKLFSIILAVVFMINLIKIFLLVLILCLLLYLPCIIAACYKNKIKNSLQLLPSQILKHDVQDLFSFKALKSGILYLHKKSNINHLLNLNHLSKQHLSNNYR